MHLLSFRGTARARHTRDPDPSGSSSRRPQPPPNPDQLVEGSVADADLPAMPAVLDPNDEAEHVLQGLLQGARVRILLPPRFLGRARLGVAVGDALDLAHVQSLLYHPPGDALRVAHAEE